MLGAAPTDGALALIVVALVDVGGLGRRNRCRARRRWRLDIRQRLPVVEQAVSRTAGAPRLARVLVRDHAGGSEFAWIPDRSQIIFGVDQAGRAGASRGL